MNRSSFSYPVHAAAVSLVVAVLAAAASPYALAQDGKPSAAPDPALLEDLVVANRFLAQEGLFDAYGHVSVRDPSNPNHYLMARSLAPAFVTADDIMEYDLDSNPIDARGRRSVLERFIHGEIYKQRPDVNAVIHTHSPTVVPFSVTNVPLRPIMHNATFLWTGVPVWEIREDGGSATDMLVRNAMLGASLARTLADKRVALMRGHGNVVVGRDVREAVRYAYYTEINARQQAAAIALGGPIVYISDEEGAARDANPGDSTRAWEMWRREALGR
jgi:ribulose-5-phosphate 4-epimerase/fuculose-1-phosphate aldolase